MADKVGVGALSVAGANPLGMQWDNGLGTYILPAQDCTEHRREFLRRGNQILSSYMGLLGLAQLGRGSMGSVAAASGLDDQTPIKIGLGNGQEMNVRLGRLRGSWQNLVDQLTSQVLVTLYGSLEAYVYDVAAAGLRERGRPASTQDLLDLLGQRQWPGKIDRLQQELGPKLGSGARRAHFTGLQMDLNGVTYSDPAEFLEQIARLRHRLVHYLGRVDQEYANTHPGVPLKVGEVLRFPSEYPALLHCFLVHFTDFVDKAFAAEFGWTQTKEKPELLVPDLANR